MHVQLISLVVTPRRAIPRISPKSSLLEDVARRHAESAAGEGGARDGSRVCAQYVSLFIIYWKANSNGCADKAFGRWLQAYKTKIELKAVAYVTFKFGQKISLF